MTALTRISGYAHVARRYGFEEAVFLDAIVFWYRANKAEDRNFRDGRWWTYNSIRAFQEVFPWWSAKQLRRIANSCREQGALLAGTYSRDRRDRSLWYTPGDELLALYGLDEAGTCTGPDGPMQTAGGTGGPAQTGISNIRKQCDTHGGTDTEAPCSPPPGDAPGVGKDEPKPKAKAQARKPRQKKSVPDHAPDRFEQFWAAYPGGGSRLRAAAAWDALAPSDELIAEMARALKRQLASRQWREGVGIPHASTWLNQQRWTDKLPSEPSPQSGGGWADDPEVAGHG